MKRTLRFIHILFFSLTLLACVQGTAQETKDTTQTKQKKFFLEYGNKGFIFQDRSGNYMMNLEFRGQFRLAYPTDNDPITNDDYKEQEIYLAIRRARIKVGGHSFRPWLKYYMEYELFSSNLLDFRLMFEKFPWLKIKIGQWKIQYNRERIISSGKQQTAERSILTREFTLDRQQGISFYGHLEGGGAANFNYWVSVFMGTGRGGVENDDMHLMYMTRLQWNPNGKVLKFSGSDIEYHKKFVMLLAMAAVTNRSPYTRFSQSGGGELEGFEPGAIGQYRVNQCMEETAGKYKGFSWQQEFHYKQIIDKINDDAKTEMLGNLIQIGYFFHGIWERFPKGIELYTRQAFFFPDVQNTNQVSNEYTMGVNWFLSGHRLKFTAEASDLVSRYAQDAIQDGWRFRVQLDISF
jgi:hypothetical protein